MPAMNSARCANMRCSKKYSWEGKITDRPACPNCGSRPPQAVLEKVQKDLESRIQFEELRRKKRES